MPAAAVTPAPIAYIKVVAVKKLVVGCLSSVGRRRSESRARVRFGCGASKLRTLRDWTTPPEWRGRPVGVALALADRFPPVIVRGALRRVSRAAGNVYFEQIRVLKAGAHHA